MCNLGQRAEISHLHLRIGDDFEIDAAGVFIDSLLHFGKIGQVAEAGSYTEAAECRGDQRVSVAEHVARCDDVFACSGHGHQRVADSGHSGAECNDIFGSGEILDLVFEIYDGRIGNSRIVRGRTAAAESIGHHVGVVKLIGGGVVDRHAQRIVSVRALETCVDCSCLFFHDICVMNLSQR